jgi:hypothetical protein
MTNVEGIRTHASEITLVPLADVMSAALPRLMGKDTGLGAIDGSHFE